MAITQQGSVRERFERLVRAGTGVMAAAKQLRVPPSTAYAWAREVASREASAPRFVQVVPERHAAAIELEVAGVVVRVHGRVDVAVLRDVLDVLREAEQ